MAAGTFAALVIPAFWPGLTDVWLFLLVLALSAVASVVVCLVTKPEPDDVLMEFYRTVRPWGFWKPILVKCRGETPALEPNRDCARDGFNVLVGIAWQIAMVAAPIYLVLRQWDRFGLSLAVFAGLSVVLKFSWYDPLGRGEGYAARDR